MHGGPSALEFTVRYHDRVSALILIAAITKTRRHPVPRPSLFRTVTDVVFGADFTDWVLIQAVRWTPYADDQERRANPDRRTLRMRLGDIRGNWITSITSWPWSKRHPGFAFDRVQAALLGERDPLPITAPTLVIHGTADRAVDFSHAQSAARRISGARLVTVDRAGHGFAPPTGKPSTRYWQIFSGRMAPRLTFADRGRACPRRGDLRGPLPSQTYLSPPQGAASLRSSSIGE